MFCLLYCKRESNKHSYTARILQGMSTPSVVFAALNLSLVCLGAASDAECCTGEPSVQSRFCIEVDLLVSGCAAPAMQWGSNISPNTVVLTRDV